MTEVLALVPAGGGSGQSGRQDLRLLAGYPLLAYAVAAGLQSRRVTRTICTTDDPEAADAALRFGADVLSLGSAGAATGQLPILQAALRRLDEEGWRPKIVVVLRPTSPLRPEGLVDRAVELLEAEPEATGVRAVCPAPCSPYGMWTAPATGGGRFLRNLLPLKGDAELHDASPHRLPPVMWQTGAVDAVRAPVLLGGSLAGERVLPLEVDRRYCADVGDEVVLWVAEALAGVLPMVRPGPKLDWARTRLLALDVDGTLTPGTMYYGPDGEVLKRFHTHDGQGIVTARAAGVEVAIITRESTSYAAARARKLGIREVYLGVEDKVSVLREVCGRLGIELSEVAYVGDDAGDLEVMRAVGAAGGIPCAVADARPEAMAAARFVASVRGGYGAVREVCDRIAAAQGREASVAPA